MAVEFKTFNRSFHDLLARNGIGWNPTSLDASTEHATIGFAADFELCGKYDQPILHVPHLHNKGNPVRDAFFAEAVDPIPVDLPSITLSIVRSFDEAYRFLQGLVNGAVQELKGMSDPQAEISRRGLISDTRTGDAASEIVRGVLCSAMRDEEVVHKAASILLEVSSLIPHPDMKAMIFELGFDVYNGLPYEWLERNDPDCEMQDRFREKCVKLWAEALPPKPDRRWDPARIIQGIPPALLSVDTDSFSWDNSDEIGSFLERGLAIYQGVSPRMAAEYELRMALSWLPIVGGCGYDGETAGWRNVARHINNAREYCSRTDDCTKLARELGDFYDIAHDAASGRIRSVLQSDG